jgi:hypothetical protein
LVCDISGASVQFVYNSSGTASWEVFAQIGGNGGTAVTLTGTQTLTNKTLTAPTIASANLTTALTLAGAAGTNGQVLTSAGSGLPSWTTLAAGYTLGTAVATTSGTAVEFLAIPAGTKQIVMTFSLVSTNGTQTKRIQLGTSAGFASTGYSSGAFSVIGAGTPAIVVDSLSSAFVITSILAAETISGSVTLTLLDAATYKWSAMGILSSTSSSFITSGTVTLAAVLDRVRLNVGDTFDGGVLNIAYI